MVKQAARQQAARQQAARQQRAASCRAAQGESVVVTGGARCTAASPVPLLRQTNSRLGHTPCAAQRPWRHEERGSTARPGPQARACRGPADGTHPPCQHPVGGHHPNPTITRINKRSGTPMPGLTPCTASPWLMVRGNSTAWTTSQGTPDASSWDTQKAGLAGEPHVTTLMLLLKSGDDWTLREQTGGGGHPGC